MQSGSMKNGLENDPITQAMDLNNEADLGGAGEVRNNQEMKDVTREVSMVDGTATMDNILKDNNVEMQEVKSSINNNVSL